MSKNNYKDQKIIKLKKRVKELEDLIDLERMAHNKQIKEMIGYKKSAKLLQDDVLKNAGLL